MICTTIQNKGQEHVLEALEQCEMAEIRLDRCPLSMEDIDVCFSSDVPLVATCRIGEIMEREPSLNVEGITPQSREIKAAQIAEKRLCRAIEAGARYVDVELEAPKHMSKRVRGVAHENGTVFIRSYHDFERTDSFEALKALVEKCRYHGADVVKIVTMAHSQEDVDRVMSLYDWDAQGNGTGRLIAFCMGDAGRESRLECLRRGRRLRMRPWMLRKRRLRDNGLLLIWQRLCMVISVLWNLADVLQLQDRKMKILLLRPCRCLHRRVLHRGPL